MNFLGQLNSSSNEILHFLGERASICATSLLGRNWSYLKWQYNFRSLDISANKKIIVCQNLPNEDDIPYILLTLDLFEILHDDSLYLENFCKEEIKEIFFLCVYVLISCSLACSLANFSFSFFWYTSLYEIKKYTCIQLFVEYKAIIWCMSSLKKRENWAFFPNSSLLRPIASESWVIDLVQDPLTQGVVVDAQRNA